MDIDFYTDRQIVDAILKRDTRITKEFLYRKCYPLFASIFSKYYTDCESPVELINAIYAYILFPDKKTCRNKLQDFGYRCSLMTWLKVVTENYCHQLFAKKITFDLNFDLSFDRKCCQDESIMQNSINIDRCDLKKILESMPNPRYSQLIELRYVEEKSNEETALLMGLTMANYYNTHKRAKEQYLETLRKEGLL